MKTPTEKQPSLIRWIWIGSLAQIIWNDMTVLGRWTIWLPLTLAAYPITIFLMIIGMETTEKFIEPNLKRLARIFYT